MSDSPPTRATLLFRLRNREDVAAWSEFVRDYGPMLYRFARSRGLQDADASDLVQEVLRSVGMAIGRLEYAKSKGGFRAWLFTIIRNKLSTYFDRRKRVVPVGNNSAEHEMLSQASDQNADLDRQWELEYQRQLTAVAIENIKPSVQPMTWLAFELTAMQGLSAEEAAEQTGLSKGAVYVARSRMTARLRDEVQRMMAEEDDST